MFLGQPFGGVIPGARGAVLAALMRTSTPMTGRRVHRLVGNHYSLWTVQEELKALRQLGLINTRTVGRALEHTVNELHVAIAPLRSLIDPISALTDIVRESVGDGVEVVVLFGSTARGEAKVTSDVDLAVIAASGWHGRTDLEDAVYTQLGNDCDVIVLEAEQFHGPPESAEPIVREIIADGITLIGSLPRRDIAVG